MENVAVVSQLGVVVGHAAELNESDGEQSYHPEQPRSRVVFAMIYAPSRVLCPSRPSLRDVSKESNGGFGASVAPATGKCITPLRQRELIMKDAT